MRISVSVFLLIFSISLWAQTSNPGAPGSRPFFPPVPADSSDTGEITVSRRYLDWAEREYAAGRTAEAIAALERGSDYGSVSSDILYFLALLYSKTGKSRFIILENCRRALETNRWESYNAETARLLEAETLSGLRRFDDALKVLDRCDEVSYKTQYQRLLALRGIAASYRTEGEFTRTLGFVMDQFPRETDPVRLLFDYASRIEQKENIRPLIDLALRRLPVLVETDPELGYMAVPFLRNKEDARIYTASYRASGNPDPASLPAAVNLGLLSGSLAVKELFAWRTVNDIAAAAQGKNQPVLKKDLIITINSLLRTEEDRSSLRRNLLQFSGVIVEDRDNDGIVEAWTTYQEGMIQNYRYDADQDGEADLIVTFAQGLPASAEITLASDSKTFVSRSMTSNKKVLLRWERYPAVLNAELDGKRYIPRPLDYFYTPFRFIPLVLKGPDYPEREALPPVLTEQSLLSFSVVFEQPSADFPGGIERVELSGGIPLKSAVFLDNKKVSETEYRSGRPVIQYLDIDLDNRMETRRRYDPDVPYKVLSTESDWDGDGMYEYEERLQEDGTIKKSWDYNRDGVRNE